MIDVKLFNKTIIGNDKIIQPFVDGISLTDRCEAIDGKYQLCDVAAIVGGLKYKTTNNGLEIAGNGPRARKIIMDKHPTNMISIESAIFRYNYEEPPERENIIRRVSWGGFLFNDGNFMNEDSPPDRWQIIQKNQDIEIKPWRDKGDHIVLILQKENDSSLKGIDIVDWAKRVVKEIRKYTDRDIIIRPHPLNPRPYPSIPDTIISTNKLLEDDLKNAWAVVAYTSLSSVESVCQGVPTFTMGKGNMAWPVGNHNLRFIEKHLQWPDRSQWLYNTAYCQWDMNEFRDGTMWKHLRPGYIKIQSKTNSMDMHKKS